MIHLGLENQVPLILYVLMFAVFLLSVFWRPNLAIYFMVLALPMQTARYKLLELPLGSHFLDILLVGAIIGLVVQRKLAIPRTSLNILLVLFAAFCFISLVGGSWFMHSQSPVWISAERFSSWKNYVEMFLYSGVIAASLREKKQVVILVGVMCVALLLVNRNYYSTLSGRDLSHFSEDVRDAGLLGYAGVNGLGAFEAMMAVFLIGLFTFAQKTWLKAAILAVVATCGYSLLFSYSRGGYVAFLAGIVAIGLVRSRWLLIAAAVLIVGWQALLPAAVQERIVMTRTDTDEGAQLDSSSEERIELWRDAMDLFSANPILGAGFDTYSYLGRVGPYQDTHNYYVKVLAETGLIGFALYLFLLRKLFNAGTVLLFGTDDPFWRAIALGFLGMLVCIVAADFFGDRWTYQQVDGYLWIILGCVLRGTLAVREALPKPAASVDPAARQAQAVTA